MGARHHAIAVRLDSHIQSGIITIPSVVWQPYGAYHSCLAAGATVVGINTIKYYWQHSYTWLLKIVIATIFDYIKYNGNFLITLQTTSVWLLVSHAKFTSIQNIPLLFSSQ